METGELFTRWIEKHPELVMKYQPLELTVRRFGFFFPLVLCAAGLALIGYGIFDSIRHAVPTWYLLLGILVPVSFVLAWFTHTSAMAKASLIGIRVLLFMLMAGIPIYGFLGCIKYGFSFGYIVLGAVVAAFFGALAANGIQAYLRALNFRLTLKDGVFHLQHGSRNETFSAEEVTQACIVRPGTVGATEGALRLRDGRMLTLDTCLSDLHALGVVMDLRFRQDFPPSADDLARDRRERLRKIRGLS